MRGLQDFDREVLTIASELDAVEKETFRPQNRERRALIKLNHCIFQLQSHLSNVLDRLANMPMSGSLLGPLERSMIHWGKVYAEKAHNYYVRQVYQLGKHMWLKLVRARLSGSGLSAEVDVSDQHLVEMSIRRTNLLQTERFLRSHQLKLEMKKGELKEQHEDLRTSIANREAAGSLSARLGQNPSEAFRNPSITGVAKYLRLLANGAQASSRSKYKYMQDLSSSISHQTDQMMSRCRNLVLDEVRYPKVEGHAQRMSEYEQSLRHIQNLQTQVAQAVNLLIEEPPTARPNLVKNSSIPAKTN